MKWFKWFYNLKAAVKLISAFVIISIILAFIGFFGLSNMDKLNASLDDMYNKRLTPISNIKDIQSLYQQMRTNVLSMHYVYTTKQEKDDVLAKSEGLKREIDDKLAAYGNRTFAQKEHEELYKKAVPAWQFFKQVFDHATQLSLEGKDAEFSAYLLNGDYLKARDELSKALQDLIDFNTNSAKQAQTDGQTQYSSSRTITIIVIVVSLLISIGFGYLISQIIARPLNRVVRLIGKVADGDLRETTDIDTKDEIGQMAQSINEMVLSLRNTISGILASAESVSAATTANPRP